jgi:hypothetical protein
MKYLSIILVLLVSLQTSAQTTYYFSTTDGNDSRSSTQAQSSSTPWQTITKLNTIWSTLNPGDTVKFKRGDTFAGSITPIASGTAENNIVLTAYGSGAKPIITGYTTITSWTNISGNIWESTSAITSGSTECFLVTLNGVAQRMGREPDATDANDGYRTIKSHTSNTSLTVAGFNPTSPSLVGKRAVVRTIRYLFDTLTIASVSWNGSDGTITFARGANLSFINGYGFFITRDSNALDQHGEWYYNPVSKKLRIYTTLNPSNYTIKAATTNTLLNIASDSYLRFEYLSFEGANQNSILITGGGSSNNTFDSCHFYGMGSKLLATTGSSLGSSSDWTFNRCDIKDGMNYGLDFRNTGSRMRFTNNTVRRIAHFAGMNTSGDRQSSTVLAFNSGDFHQITDNDIDSVGYIAIKVGGSDYSTCLRNYVRNFCMTLDDGGGIYWGYQSTQTAHFGNLIQYNIVKDGHNPYKGTSATSALVHGIYLDDNANGVRVWDNTVTNVMGAGIFLHNVWASSFLRNTLHGCFLEQFGFQHDAPDHPINTDTIMYNKLIATYRTSVGNPYIIQYRNYNNDDATNGDLTTIGKIDSNYYVRPNQDSTNATTGAYIRTHVANNGLSTYTTVNRTLPNWRSITPYDDNTKQSPLQFIGKNMDTLSVLLINPNSTDSTHIISQQYMTLEGEVKNPPSVTIPAYGSLFLMETGIEPPPSNQSPNANAGNNQSVTLPYPIISYDTLSPSDDIYTRQSTPTTSYAAADSLLVKTGVNVTRRAYMKFNLSGLPAGTITSAKLRLYSWNVENSDTRSILFYKVASDNWFESSVVWTGQPDYTAGNIAAVNVNNTAQYREVTITP